MRTGCAEPKTAAAARLLLHCGSTGLARLVKGRALHLRNTHERAALLGQSDRRVAAAVSRPLSKALLPCTPVKNA